MNYVEIDDVQMVAVLANVHLHKEELFFIAESNFSI